MQKIISRCRLVLGDPDDRDYILSMPGIEQHKYCRTAVQFLAKTDAEIIQVTFYTCRVANSYPIRTIHFMDYFGIYIDFFATVCSYQVSKKLDIYERTNMYIGFKGVKR